MRISILLLFIGGLFSFENVQAQTIIPAGNVSGTWTAANSPYQVQGVAVVQGGQTLTIEPGVIVQFVSTGRLRVKGNLIASGTVSDSIRFTPISINSGWRGIQIDTVSAVSDSSIFEHCIFEHSQNVSLLHVNSFNKVRVEHCKFQYGDATTGAGLSVQNSSIIIRYNMIRNNVAAYSGGGININNCYPGPVVEGNTFINNNGGGQGGGIAMYSSYVAISSNIFYDNFANYGGALLIGSGSYPLIADNIFDGNTASTFGGVAWCASTDPIVLNNVFTNNDGGGGGGAFYFSTNSDPFFEGNYYEGNHATNGGVYYLKLNTHGIFKNEVCYNNSGSSGGVILCWDQSSVKAENCRFINNEGIMGGTFYFTGNNVSGTVKNCLIANSEAYNGGAIVVNSGATPKFTNCTISNNKANNRGGAIHSYSGGVPVFTNCIFSGNTCGGLGATYYNQTGTTSLSSPSFIHCNVEGGQSEIILNGSSYTAWTNNLDSDPLFIDPSLGSGITYDGFNADWRLQSSSPCYNSGTPDTTGLSLPLTDLGGGMRVVIDTVDMGAYEVQLGLNAYGISGDTNLCQGDSLLISAVVSGVNPVTYQWQMNGVDIAGATEIDLAIEGIASNAGDYWCIVSNGFGTDTTSILSVTYHNVSTLSSLGPDSSLCNGDSLLLISDSGYNSYLWNNGLSTNDSLSAVTTASYFYQAIDANNCILKSDSITVTFNTLPVFDLGADIGTCDSSTIWLNPLLSDVIFDWNNGFSSADSLDVNLSGDYTLEVVDTNNCVFKDTINVTYYPHPIVNLVSDTLCEGELYTLNAGSGYVNYNWNNGLAFSQSISADTSGFYFVQVTDVNGCVGLDTANVLFHANPTIDLGMDQEICFGDSVQLAVLENFVSYNWNNGYSTDSSVYINTNGQWFVEVTDSNACSALDTIILTVNPLPVVDLGGPFEICTGDSVLLYVANSYQSYDWNNGLSNNDSIVVNTAGFWYVDVVDANSCENSDSVTTTIVFPSAGTEVAVACDAYTWIDGTTYYASNSTAQWTLINAVGCDSIVTLNLTINNATVGTDVVTNCDSYTWIDGNTYTSSNNSAQWTLTNSQGCDSVVTLDLTILNATFGTDVIAACDSYIWIDGTTYSSSNNTAQWILTNAQGCDSVVTLDLTINSATANVISDDPELIADPGATSYQWLDCQNNFATINGETSNTFLATANGEYAVLIEENGCVDTSACFVINNVALSLLHNQNWKLFPNPTNDYITIQFHVAPSNTFIEITNSLGQTVSTQEVNASSIELKLGVQSGIYFVRVISENGEEVVPIVKL